MAMSVEGRVEKALELSPPPPPPEQSPQVHFAFAPQSTHRFAFTAVTKPDSQPHLGFGNVWKRSNDRITSTWHSYNTQQIRYYVYLVLSHHIKASSSVQSRITRSRNQTSFVRLNYLFFFRSPNLRDNSTKSTYSLKISCLPHHTLPAVEYFQRQTRRRETRLPSTIPGHATKLHFEHRLQLGQSFQE